VKQYTKLAFLGLFSVVTMACNKKNPSPISTENITKEYRYDCVGEPNKHKDTLTDLEGTIIAKKYYYNREDTSNFKMVYLIKPIDSKFKYDLFPTEDLGSDFSKVGLNVKISCYLTYCHLSDLKNFPIIRENEYHTFVNYFPLGQKIFLTKINAI
jgi:hypothetical protein